MFTSYLTTWLRELCECVGFYSGERREQWRGFKQSLEQLRDTGVQPRQGEVRVNGGSSAWWQTHTECFTQERNAGTHSWYRETESRPKRPRQAGPGVLQGVQDLIAELVAKAYRIVYTDGSSKRLSHKDMRRAGYSQRKMSKGVRCVSAAMCRHATGKQTTERSFGQHWKPYRGSGCQNWQSSPTHSTCNWEQPAGPSTGSQKDGQPHPVSCRSTCPSGKCCSRKWRSLEEKSGGSTSQHMLTCRGMRWRMDWRWKACAQARCGPSMSHNSHHQGRSPR